MTWNVRISHRTLRSGPETVLGNVRVESKPDGTHEANGDLNSISVQAAFAGVVTGRAASMVARVNAVGWVVEHRADGRYSYFRDDDTGLEGYVTAV